MTNGLRVEPAPDAGPRVATVWLDRPPVNAVDQNLYRRIREVFVGAEEFGDARAVVLAGEGPHFCAGNDLAEFETMTPRNGVARMADVHAAFTAIRHCPVPVVGALHGMVLGTGVAIAASCDLLVAAEGTRLGLPEMGVGVMGGARHLARLAPPNVVREMFLRARPVPVERLLPFGGFVAVVPQESLLDEARAVAADVARHSPLALRVAKIALNAIEFTDVEQGYAAEQRHTVAMSGTHDAKEALAAMRERREPAFEGR